MKKRFKVRELAQEQGLTTEDLARKSGLRFATVRNVWQGRHSNPSYDTIKAIAKALNVPMEELEHEDFDAPPALLRLAA